MTLRNKLTVWYAVLLTLIIFLLGAVVYGIMRWTFTTNVDRTLEMTVQEVNRSSRLVVIPPIGQPSRVEITLPTLNVFHVSDVEVQVWTLEDGEFVMTDNTPDIASFDQPFDVEALGLEQRVFSHIVIDGVAWRTLTTPIYDPNGQLIGNIQTAGSLAMLTHMTRDFAIALAICCLLTCVGAVVIIRWLTKRMLKPIDDLTHAAANVVRARDLTTRLEWDGPNDELGRLINVFNSMMVRLEHLFGVQQRFVADISHELRTPLTSIKGNVEMMQAYGPDDISLEAIASESERMHRLVNDLLLLARADYGGITIDMMPVDLDALFIEVFNQARTLAKAKNITVKLVNIEPLQVSGNADRLKQTLLNLIDNAIKFTSEGGQLTLNMSNQAGCAVIEVADTGIGIAQGDLERIFDRFYQSDPARTYSGTGFGLGLSIAQWIVKAHGGTIEVTSELGKGTTFRLMLPLLNSGSGKTPDPDLDLEVTRPRISVRRREERMRS